MGKAVENREISVEELLKTGEKQDSQKNGKSDIFFDCRCFKTARGYLHSRSAAAPYGQEEHRRPFYKDKPDWRLCTALSSRL